MVQVDVFWSYGIGAGFAVANTWQLQTHQSLKKSPYEHNSFRDTLLFLACLFVPSGAFLVWQYPSWETMHVGSRDMPGWLVAAFTVTNFTQGVLGFAIAAALLGRKRQYEAYLQWILGYFAMLFVLVHGWDGTGYMRFFSSTREELNGWTWTNVPSFAISDIAQSLIAMGAVVLPVMFGMMVRDLRRGYPFGGGAGTGRADEPDPMRLGFSLLATLLLGVLSAAILASVAVRYLGPVLGALAFLVVAYFVGLRRGGVFHRHFRHVVYREPFKISNGRIDSAAKSAIVSQSGSRRS